MSPGAAARPADMIARVWTREELDRVHQLREGWEWRLDLYGNWCAHMLNSEHEVWGENGDLYWTDGLSAIPDDVAEAAILASKGLDSREAMADAMADVAKDMHARSKVGGGYSDELHARTAMGRATQAAEDAAMVRRGTVKPP